MKITEKIFEKFNARTILGLFYYHQYVDMMTREERKKAFNDLLLTALLVPLSIVFLIIAIVGMFTIGLFDNQYM